MRTAVRRARGSTYGRVMAVDVATGWVEMDVVWGKPQEQVGAAMRKIHRRLPVPLLGLDGANGSEFITRRLYNLLRKQWDHLHPEPSVPQARRRSHVE